MAKRSQKTPLSSVIFDTDVLIWYFRGNEKAREFLAHTPFESRWICSVTLMELLQGARHQNEIRDIEAFVAQNISKIIHPKTSVSEKAIHLVSQYALSHGLRVVDAFIGASALLSRAILATGNSKHFKFINGLAVKEFNT